MKDLEMIVEIPKASNNKYEFDNDKLEWKLDRVLTGSMVYPEEYGFIPATLDCDSDPLDVVCITNFSTFPGCRIPIRVLGVLRMVDQDELDYKLIAVNAVDSRLSHVKTLEELGNGKLEEINNFFLRYKELENKTVSLEGYGNLTEALEIIKECQLIFGEAREAFPSGYSKKEISLFLQARANKKKEK